MNYRLALAIEEDGKAEKIAEHFGRCTKFIVCELDEQKKVLKTETFFNPLAGEHNGSCQLPGYVKQFNVNTIIAGGMGQKAISNFLALGINVITAPGIFFNEALERFIQGKLVGYQACLNEGNHKHHHHN